MLGNLTFPALDSHIRVIDLDEDSWRLVISRLTRLFLDCIIPSQKDANKQPTQQIA